MQKRFSLVKNYEFVALDEESLRPENLLNIPLVREENHSLDEEIAFADKNDFKIFPIVEERRGIKDYKKAKEQQHLEEEIERRLEQLRGKAYEEGYEEGREKGMKDVYDELRVQAEEKLEAFSEMVGEALEIRNQLIWKEKKQIYQVVKTLAKWIVLRELKTDEHYMERLLERLVHEIQTKSGLFIQVNKKHFAKMPELIQSIESRIGTLENVRIEVSSDIDHDKGIIVSSENGIINGTVEEQLKGLDKIFEKIDEIRS